MTKHVKKECNHTDAEMDAFYARGVSEGNCCVLFTCAVCTAWEGGLTTECPGRVTTYDEQEQVYAGKIDFINGQWIKK